MMGRRFGLMRGDCLLIVDILPIPDFQNFYGNCLLINSINDPVIANPYPVHVF